MCSSRAGSRLRSPDENEPPSSTGANVTTQKWSHPWYRLTPICLPQASLWTRLHLCTVSKHSRPPLGAPAPAARMMGQKPYPGLG